MINIWRCTIGLGLVFWIAAIVLKLTTDGGSVEEVGDIGACGAVILGVVLISFALNALSLLQPNIKNWWVPKFCLAVGLIVFLSAFLFIFFSFVMDVLLLRNKDDNDITALNTVLVGFGALMTSILLTCSALLSLSILQFRDRHSLVADEVASLGKSSEPEERMPEKQIDGLSSIYAGEKKETER